MPLILKGFMHRRGRDSVLKGERFRVKGERFRVVSTGQGGDIFLLPLSLLGYIPLTTLLVER